MIIAIIAGYATDTRMTCLDQKRHTRPIKEKLNEAQKIMDGFSLRTGLSGNKGDIGQRYLWTDAFAVQTFFGLAHTS